LAFDFPSDRQPSWLHFVTATDDLPLTLLPTDLVACHEASPELQKRIKQEGIVIYERSEKA
jgi:hypothetical protein